MNRFRCKLAQVVYGEGHEMISCWGQKVKVTRRQKVTRCNEKTLKGSSRMPAQDLQIELWRRVTLIFDLLTPKLIVSSCWHVDHLWHLCQFAAKLVIRFQNIVFTRLVTNELTNERMDERTDTSRTLAVWLSGNTLASFNVVALHQTRLVLGWVTVCGRVNHLGM